MNNTTKTLLLLFIIITSTILYLNQKQQTTTITTEQGKKIKATIAQTEQEKEQGLMNKKTLPENEGMLFIYDKEQNLTFWMKNTTITLDILFINKEKKITNIQTMTPCEKEPCTTYNSPTPAQYALEINTKETKKYDLKEGQTLTFKT